MVPRCAHPVFLRRTWQWDGVPNRGAGLRLRLGNPSCCFLTGPRIRSWHRLLGQWAGSQVNVTSGARAARAVLAGSGGPWVNLYSPPGRRGGTARLSPRVSSGYDRRTYRGTQVTIPGDGPHALFPRSPSRGGPEVAAGGVNSIVTLATTLAACEMILYVLWVKSASFNVILHVKSASLIILHGFSKL